jgi:hypothetical protein
VLRTPDEFKAMADQCVNWAREAPNTDARDACFMLARLWLKEATREAAAGKGLPVASTLAPSTQNGHS